MKRRIAVFIGAVVLYLINSGLLSRIPYLSAVPNLSLVYVFSTGVFWGAPMGLAVGVFSGLMLDVYEGVVLGFYAILFMMVGASAGFFHQRIDEEMPAVPLAMGFFYELLYSLYVFVFRFMIRNRLQLGQYVKEVILPEMILTLIAGVLIYGGFLVIHNALDRRERLSLPGFTA